MHHLSIALNAALSALRLAITVWTTWKYHTYAAALVVISAVLLALRPSYRHWNTGWLSSLVDERLAYIAARKRKERLEKWLNILRQFNRPSAILGYCKHGAFSSFEAAYAYCTSGLWSDVKALYFPSWTSFGVFSLAIAALVLLSANVSLTHKLTSLSGWTDDIDPKVLSHDAVVAVLAGLVAVIFALIVFVSESIRDSKQREQRRVLLSTSWLWPLALASVLTLLGLLLLDITKLTIFLVLLLGGAVILSFARVIRTLLDPDLLAQSRATLLKDRTKRIIHESARQRVATNILLSRIGDDKEIKLSYAFSSSWLSRREQGFIFIDSPKTGRISDINLSELAALYSYLDEQARRLGFSIYKKNDATIEGGAENVPIRQARTRQATTVRPAYLLKRYGQWLQPNSIFSRDARTIFAIPEEFNQAPTVVKDTTFAMRRIFRFDAKEEASASFRRELQATKDQLIVAIRSTSFGAIKELRSEYLQLAETFLEVMQEYVGGYPTTISAIWAGVKAMAKGWDTAKMKMYSLRYPHSFQNRCALHLAQSSQHWGASWNSSKIAI